MTGPEIRQEIQDIVKKIHKAEITLWPNEALIINLRLLVLIFTLSRALGVYRPVGSEILSNINPTS